MPTRSLLAASLALVLGALLLAACDGDDGDAGATGSPAATATSGEPPEPAEREDRSDGEEPDLESPVSQFVTLLEDIGEDGYRVEHEGTQTLSADQYAATVMFDSEEEGASKLRDEWGYVGGYRTGFEPRGRTEAVLEGDYYASIELHLFEESGGASGFLEYIEERLDGTRASEIEDAPALANESSAWAGSDVEPVPGSQSSAIFHWYAFRRGNLVAIVRTWGAESLMTVNRAFDLAVIIDEKAAGDRPAVEPTPIPTEEEGNTSG